MLSQNLSILPLLQHPTHHSHANSTLSGMVHVRREGGKEMEQKSKGQAQDKHVQGEEETK